MTTIPTAQRPPTADELVATATSEVLVTITAPSVPHPVHFRNLRRGVRYRVLAVDAARTGLTKFAFAGAEVRTVPEIVTDAVVIDGATAVYPAERGAAGFRLPGVVATAVEHFERLWTTGTSLLPGDDTELLARERDLLSLLASGHTDAAVADELGVSVRTVRRLVADLMNRLGARSRFMAGAKAADRGWLPASELQAPPERKIA